MYKKLFALLMLLISITALIGYEKKGLYAEISEDEFYERGDTFESTSKNTFSMGGIEWRIVYSDISTGKGYIIGSAVSPNIVLASVPAYLQTAQNAYSISTSNDAIGEIVKENNDVSTLRMMRLEEYDIITANEANINMLSDNYGDFWMETHEEKEILYWYYGNVPLSPYRHICLSNGGVNSVINPIFEINLPQKGIIKNIKTDRTSVTKQFYSDENTATQPIVNAETIGGKGQFHFYIYDTDENGIGDATVPSDKFVLETDPTNGTAVVKQAAMLSAGDHYFKIKVVDESLNNKVYYSPNDFTRDKNRTKVSDTIRVTISNNLPNIKFQNQNQTKKSTEEATASWQETAIAQPSIDQLKIRYSVSGGDINLINIDSNTGVLTYNGDNNQFGKATIRAELYDETLGDDSLSYTEKEIIIYRKVDGIIIPDAASVDSSIPSFNTSDANVKIDGIIGRIEGTLGTPDSIDEGNTTYRYALKSGGNANFFKVNANSGVITTSANLAVGTYSFTITVSDKWSSKDIPVTVVVGMAPAENLKFYENSTSSTVITTKSARAADTGVSVNIRLR